MWNLADPFALVSMGGIILLPDRSATKSFGSPLVGFEASPDVGVPDVIFC